MENAAILAQALPFWLKDGHCFCVVRQFSFVFPVRRRKMPRKGWSTVQVPDGWLKVIRGPRPPATKWPRVQHSTQPQGAERHTTCSEPATGPATGASRSGHSHDQRQGQNVEVGSSPCRPWARKTRFIQDCWRRSRWSAPRHRRSQCKTASQGLNSFWARQETCQRLPSRCGEGREALAAAEAKLLSEEDAVRQAEDRLRVLRQEEAAGGVQESPPATMPANFAQELAQLRDFVSELQRERDELRTELQGEHRNTPVRGRRTSLYPHLRWNGWPCRARERERSLHHDGNVDRSSGECSEVRLIGHAHELLVSERDARFGHRESRIGETSHPGPLECPPMQVASHGDIMDCLEFDFTRCDSADNSPPPVPVRKEGVCSGERSTCALSPIRFQPPITIGSRCWTHPCWQMIPLVLSRSLRWKLTTFQWCTVGRGCV